MRREYFDICHDGKTIWLWVHDGKRLDARRSKRDHEHLWERRRWPATGRVDPGKKVGTIGLDSEELPRAAIKRVVEDVMERFPGVRFTVFHESDYGVGLQEFWERL